MNAIKIQKYLFRGVQAILILAMLKWTVEVGNISGKYLLSYIYVQTFGTTVSGTILDIRKNPEINIRGNYLARVSYVGPTGEPLTQDFRYGEAKITGASEVSVIYLKDHPTIAALKEDGGYFAGTMQGFLSVLGGLAFALGLFLFLDFSVVRRR